MTVKFHVWIVLAQNYDDKWTLENNFYNYIFFLSYVQKYQIKKKKLISFCIVSLESTKMLAYFLLIMNIYWVEFAVASHFRMKVVVSNCYFK